jgi:hypothetical protein
MLHRCAIDQAVSTFSPVHIVTRTPAFLHLATASRTPSRRGSSIPVMPIRVRSVAKLSYSTCQWPVSGRHFNNKRNCYLSVVHELSAFGGPASEITITQRDGMESPRSVERDHA